MNPANANSPSWPSTMGTRTAASNWLVQCIVWSAIPMGLLLMLKGPLMAFWQMTLSFWGDALQLSLVTQLSPEGQTLLWTPLDDGSFAPSAKLLVVTAAMTAGIWWLGNRLSERFYPLKISLRAMCLIQWCACLFFWLTPSHFPYSIGSHADALMGMGYGLMLAIGPMLALGWGILPVPVWQKLGAPLAFMAYFALMLPHKTLLHVWCLEQGSILFMPLLFLCFGALLDLWIFIALYAWLASTTPALRLSPETEQNLVAPAGGLTP
jgi:hypothetical protein